VFNAVIVLVSHLVDPLHSNDKIALAKVELALHMIQTMSRNHAFAARAHSFLQRVLDYTYQSAAQRQGNRDDTMVGDIFPLPPLELPTEMQDDPTAVPNIQTYFGLPDDITNGLDLYQGRLDVKDHALAPWSFNDQWFF
jgi:hypothetical protein